MGLASPNAGVYASYCGSESEIVCHGAFEPTNICACGRMPGSASSVPAGMTAIPASGKRSGATEPQVVQNDRVRSLDDW
jgi:hypothetical protein